MEKVSIIGLDIAKSVFQAHGADATGAVVFRKKISRAKLLEFFASQPVRLVAMEACFGALRARDTELMTQTASARRSRFLR